MYSPKSDLFVWKGRAPSNLTAKVLKSSTSLDPSAHSENALPGFLGTMQGSRVRISARNFYRGCIPAIIFARTVRDCYSPL